MMSRRQVQEEIKKTGQEKMLLTERSGIMLSTELHEKRRGIWLPLQTESKLDFTNWFSFCSVQLCRSILFFRHFYLYILPVDHAVNIPQLLTLLFQLRNRETINKYNITTILHVSTTD